MATLQERPKTWLNLNVSQWNPTFFQPCFGYSWLFHSSWNVHPMKTAARVIKWYQKIKIGHIGGFSLDSDNKPVLSVSLPGFPLTHSQAEVKVQVRDLGVITEKMEMMTSISSLADWDIRGSSARIHTTLNRFMKLYSSLWTVENS